MSLGIIDIPALYGLNDRREQVGWRAGGVDGRVRVREMRKRRLSRGIVAWQESWVGSRYRRWVNF